MSPRLQLALAVAVAASAATLATPTAAQSRAAREAAAAAAAASAAAAKQDQADLDRSQIIGNRELPKVTYIVPWKKPGPGDLAGRPLVSVLDEALSPVDRDVFRRQVRYDGQAVSRSAVPASPAPAK
jgi:type II secretory pathway pseudopilin PulG